MGKAANAPSRYPWGRVEVGDRDFDGDGDDEGDSGYYYYQRGAPWLPEMATV